MATEPAKPPSSSWLLRFIRRVLPPAVPQPEDRESIWSISRRDARAFFRLVSIMWLAALAYVCHRTAQTWPAAATQSAVPRQWWESAGDFALAVMAEFSLVVLGIAILALLMTRPLILTGEILMSLYQAMVNRFVTPVIQQHEARGRAAGLKEGRTAGLKEGRVTERAQWQEWNRRRLAAEAKGQPFNEPPPGD